MFRALLPLAFVSTTLTCPGLTVHVAPDGDDANPGTADQPVRTLEEARDRVRAEARQGGHRAVLRGGIHTRLVSFKLDPADSGLPDAPNVYESWPGETAVLVGGITVPPDALQSARNTLLFD